MQEISSRVLIQVWDEVDAQLSHQPYTRARGQVWVMAGAQCFGQILDGVYSIIETQARQDHLK